MENLWLDGTVGEDWEFGLLGGLRSEDELREMIVAVDFHSY